MEQAPFQNDHLRCTLHQKPACVVEYAVEALEPLVQEARKKAIKKVAKEVSLPGFRKGKAPEQMVVKNFSTQVDKEWQQEIANVTFLECQKLAPVRLLKDGKINYAMKS